jgi:phage tail sheath protein FI
VTLTDTPTAYQQTGSSPLGYGSLGPGQIAPQPGFSVISPVDFEPVFQDYASLDKVPVFNLLATPGITYSQVTSEAVAYCERKRAFYIMDTPSSQTSGWDVNSIVGDLDQSTPLDPAPPVSVNAAVYYPWLQTADPVTGNTTDPVTGNAIVAPPSGFVAGIFGQTDSAQGVWQSPAGLQTTILGTTGVDTNGVMTDPQQGILNNNALNCLRQFPGIGTVVFGARTTAAADPSYQQWKYVAVRRMALFIEQTLYANLGWAVFEGNSTPLWNALTQEVTAFMLSLFRQGAFAGDTPSTAFLVQCDSTTTTPQDVASGRVNILVGFAPLLPAEFVVVQIAQLAGQTQS